MRIDTHKLLLKEIRRKGRLLNKNEVFDFYTEKVMTKDATCRIIYTINGIKTTDYPLWELKERAREWYRRALGSLVLKGELEVVIPLNKERRKNAA